MNDRPNHRAAAERMLADADEWAAQAGELSPKASERACLDRAQVHALLAVHDKLAAAGRYFAIEAKQRDAEWLVLDEDDHRDRLDGAGSPITRVGHLAWTHPALRPWRPESLVALNAMFGPLTFAPEPAQDGTGDDLTASEGESGSVEGEGADDASEAILCPECGHGIDRHTYDCPGDRCRDCDDCPRALSDVARSLITEAAKAERLSLAREVRELAPRVMGNSRTLTDLAERWEADTDG